MAEMELASQPCTPEPTPQFRGNHHKLTGIDKAFQVEKDLKANKFKSLEDLIAYYGSEKYRKALSVDLPRIPRNFLQEDRYFQRHYSPPANLPFARIECFEGILNSLFAVDPTRYQTFHKGTAFYWLAMASYRAGDFERALFYLDAAISEDYRADPGDWAKHPAGLFMQMETDNPNQAGREENRRTVREYEKANAILALRGGSELDVIEFRKRLVSPSVEKTPELRSVVTAILSFLLEFPVRKNMAQLAKEAGTNEPFLVHLFKGAQIFETLLSVSSIGKQVSMKPRPQGKKPGLFFYLSDAQIHNPLGFREAPTGHGELDFSGVIQKAKDTQSDPYNDRCIRLTWCLRNSIGHSLGSSHRISPEEYEDLFACVYGAISLAILKLY